MNDADMPSEAQKVPQSGEPRPDYFGAFGEYIPNSLCRYVTQMGMWPHLDRMLQEQIDKGEPVKDWKKFSDPFVRPFLAPHVLYEEEFGESIPDSLMCLLGTDRGLVMGEMLRAQIFWGEPVEDWERFSERLCATPRIGR